MDARVCPFCEIWQNKTRTILLQTARFFAIEPVGPVTEGHTLIIPKAHTDNIFQFSLPESTDLIIALRETKKLLDKRFYPEGYNIGVNCGEEAGQSVFHTHIHLIPRHTGDVPDPRGGIIRNILKGYRPT